MIVLITLATLVLSAGFVASGELLSGGARHMATRERGVPVALNLQQSAPFDEPAEEPAHVPGLAELVGAHGPGMVAVVPANDAVAAVPVAAKLARDLAWRGGRTVLIELDPRIAASSLVRDPTAPGVVNLVRGTASFGQVIHRDRTSRLHVVPIGGPVAEIEELLKAERLSLALSALAQTTITLSLPRRRPRCWPRRASPGSCRWRWWWGRKCGSRPRPKASMTSSPKPASPI